MSTEESCGFAKIVNKNLKRLISKQTVTVLIKEKKNIGSKEDKFK